MNGPLKLAHVTRGSQSTSTTSTTTTRPNPGWLGLITTFHPQGWATKEGTKEGHRSLGAYPRSADLARSDFVTPARRVSHIDGGYLHIVGNDNPRRHAIAWKLAASGVHELLEQISLVHPGGINRGQTHRDSNAPPLWPLQNHPEDCNGGCGSGRRPWIRHADSNRQAQT